LAKNPNNTQNDGAEMQALSLFSTAIGLHIKGESYQCLYATAIRSDTDCRPADGKVLLCTVNDVSAGRMCQQEKYTQSPCEHVWHRPRKLFE
jgi:hypothetical protein